jgi:hypothetical protein
LNFVSGDYYRKTGLVGNGGTKYLDSNRNNNADPQDSFHVSGFFSTVGANFIIAGGVSTGRTSLGEAAIRLRSSTGDTTGGTSVANTFAGGSRSSSAAIVRRANGVNNSITRNSETPEAGNLFVFARNNNGTADTFATHCLAFYSIGESLDLALLDARVSALITAFGVAIP